MSSYPGLMEEETIIHPFQMIPFMKFIVWRNGLDNVIILPSLKILLKMSETKLITNVDILATLTVIAKYLFDDPTEYDIAMFAPLPRTFKALVNSRCINILLELPDGLGAFFSDDRFISDCLTTADVAYLGYPDLMVALSKISSWDPDTINASILIGSVECFVEAKKRGAPFRISSPAAALYMYRGWHYL